MKLKMWTRKEKELFNGNYSIKTISKLTGRSLGAVYSFYHKHKVDLGLKVKENKKEKIIALVKKGYTNQQIKEEVNTTDSNISVVRKSIGMEKKVFKYTYEEEMAIFRYHKEGKAINWIAKKLGRTYNSVFNKIQKMRKRGWFD